jgi:hypothetical protein
MRIFTQLLLLATAIVLGVALAAATNPKPILRAVVIELTGGPMGVCARSPACRRVMDIPARPARVPDRGPYKLAPADMDRA